MKASTGQATATMAAKTRAWGRSRPPATAPAIPAMIAATTSDMSSRRRSRLARSAPRAVSTASCSSSSGEVSAPACADGSMSSALSITFRFVRILRGFLLSVMLRIWACPRGRVGGVRGDCHVCDPMDGSQAIRRPYEVGFGV